MTDAEKQVILSAARLARMNPNLWQEFADAFQLYSSSQLTNLVSSPLETLPTMQGRAQTAAQVYGMLAECISRADKIEGKK